MAVVERRDVWALTREKEWHSVLEWYARAVRELQAIADTADPRSWLYLANIHGTDLPRSQWPPEVDRNAWNACQHGSWYFLPWHRAYLHHFEKIIRDTVVGLGGPPDWALPFWNYDPADPETLSLPPAFRAERTPDNEPNPLFVARRAAEINNGDPLDPSRVETTVGFPPRPWTSRFTSSFVAQPTFGGTRSGFIHSGRGGGQLEIEPHGPVHVDVGGFPIPPAQEPPPGLMSRFETAGQDPVFWLHHANIDRLWEVWRNRDGNLLPEGESRWMDAGFEFGRAGVVTSLQVSDVLQTSAEPLGYRYQYVPEPVSLEGVAVREPESERAPELVGASEEPVPLAQTTTSEIPMELRKGLSPEGVGVEVYLSLEMVTGSTLGAGSYTIALGDEQVGTISTFGVVEASAIDEDHNGSGLTFSFDVTDVVARLREEGAWDPDHVRVTITPAVESTGDDLQVGRIGIYYWS